MEDMPEVNNCFGTFPPKYACFLISIFGMGAGGVGLAGIIIYGIMEESVLAHFINTSKMDIGLKKATLGTIGLSSLCLLIGNFILFLGVIFHKKQAVDMFVIIIFVLCSLLILGCIAAPMSCFFMTNACLIKRISIALMVVLYLFMMVYLDVWLYFMIVAFSFSKSM